MEFNLLINRDINDYDIDCLLNSTTIDEDSFPYGEKAKEVLKKLNYELNDYNHKKLFDTHDIVVNDNLEQELNIKKILTVGRDVEIREHPTDIYYKAFKTAIGLGLKSIAVFFYESGDFKDKFDNGITNLLVAFDKINNSQRGALKVYAMLSEHDGLMINKKIFLNDDIDSKSPFIDYYNKDKGLDDIYYNDSEATIKIYNLKRFMASLDEKKFAKIDRKINYPFEFLEMLFEGKEKDFNKILKECKLDRRRKNRLKTTKTLNKETVISLSIALELNKELTTQFLMIAGYSFSIYEQLDMLVIEYFMKEKIKSFELFDNYVELSLGRHLKF